jgi:hypothetical protein
MVLSKIIFFIGEVSHSSGKRESSVDNHSDDEDHKEIEQQIVQLDKF